MKNVYILKLILKGVGIIIIIIIAHACVNEQ